MRYFVTGATGFIGGRLVRQLRERGDEVVALVRTPSRAKDLEELGVELRTGDVREPGSVRDAMEGCERVFHVAAWYKLGGRERSEARSINVEGTRTVLEAARELDVKKVVYTSTIAVHSDTKGRLVDESYRHNGPFISLYDESKHEAHYKVALPMMADGLPLVVVMPGVVYGPGDHSAIRDTLVDYLQGKLPGVPQGARYCWGHVEDIARGHIQAMERGEVGECYHLTGPDLSLAEVLKMAQDITGIPVPRLTLPAPALRLGAKLMGAVEQFVNVPSGLSAEALRASAGVTYVASSAKARDAFGFDTRPVREGLKETVAHEMDRLGRSA